MDLQSIEAHTTSMASQAAKGGLHALWIQTAAHPRTATIVALVAIVGAFVAGLVIGG